MAGHGRPVAGAVLLSTLVTLTSLVGAIGARPAGADQLSALRSQAATVSQQLVLEQLQVDALRQQSSVAAARVTADATAISHLDQQIVADQQAIDQRRSLVRHQAILSYIDSGSDTSSADRGLFSGGGAEAQAASEYTALAIGNITTALDQLHAAQETLVAEQAVLVQREAGDRADQAGQAADVTRATAAAGRLGSEQALVSGQLATAVARQQAAESAAATAAVARAERVAPRPPPPVSTVPTIPEPTQATSTVTSAPAASGTTQPAGDPNLPDPALNPFLQCVVQVESGGNYGAVSPDGVYRGAFQFSQATWNTAAQAAGLGYLVGVAPNLATKAEQDTVAVALYALDGQRPWLGDRCSS